MDRRVVLVAAALVLSFGTLACEPRRADPPAEKLPPIRVTGIPDENPTELARKSQPMVDYLSAKLGREVVYVPVTDYGAAVQALSAKKVDFAWLGGFTFVQAKLLAKAEPLCMRDVDRDFKSVFIATTASGISTLEGLKGKKFAFGSKSSTSGHLMPRHYMLEAKIDPEKDFGQAAVFSGAHDATAKMVEGGTVDAGALNVEVWQRMVDKKQIDTAKVKVFWTTPGYVDYVWAASPEVEPAIRAKFRDAFLSLDPANPEHKAVLDLQGAKKFVPASATDFDALEVVGRSSGLIK